MTARVRDIVEAMDRWAPPQLAYEWDRAGLALGHPSDRVTGVLTCLTVTRDAFRAAKTARANFIVAHHPLIWDPLKTLRSDDAHAALVLDLAQAGFGCFSAHTNLDVAGLGVNAVLAAKLGFAETSPLFPVPQAEMWKLVTFVPESHLHKVRMAVSAAGAGGIGNYTHCTFSAPGVGTFMPAESASPFSGEKLKLNEEPERRFETIFPKHLRVQVLAALRDAHPYEEIAYDLYKLENGDPSISLGLRFELPKPLTLAALAESVRKKLGLKHVRYTGGAKARVRRVAVMGGSGGSSAANVPGDVDVFVTGDVKYHEALDAQERGLAIIDAGHHGTELPVVSSMASHLKALLPKLRVKPYLEPDPFTVITPR
jgi:dinuclear metal center YbgI/SA1388 family protein